MTDNVTPFRGARKDDPETRRILACDCGCLSFTLLESGDAVCSACDTPAAGETAGWMEADPPFGTATGGADAFIDHQFEAPEFARAKVLRDAASDRTVFIGSVDGKGIVSAWTSRRASGRADWLVSRLDEFKAAVLAWSPEKD